MLLPTIGIGGIMLSSRPSGCLCVCCPSVCCSSINAYFACCNISLLSLVTLLKLATNIHNVSGCHWKGFQGQMLKIKVMISSDAIIVEAYISIAWHCYIFFCEMSAKHTSWQIFKPNGLKDWNCASMYFLVYFLGDTKNKPQGSLVLSTVCEQCLSK